MSQQIHDYKLVRGLRSEISALQTRLSDTRALCKLLNRNFQRGPISNERDAKINTEWARLITPYEGE